jgi:hypothetical protein
MAYNFNIVLRGFDNKELTDNGVPLTMARAIADALAVCKEDALRAYDLGLKIYKGEPVDLTKSDLEFISGVVRQSALIPLAKAPVIREIDRLLAESKSA